MASVFWIDIESEIIRINRHNYIKWRSSVIPYQHFYQIDGKSS